MFAGWRRNCSLANTSEKLERVNWSNSFIRCVLVSGELTKAGGMNEYVIGAELSRVWVRFVCLVDGDGQRDGELKGWRDEMNKRQR